MQNMIEYPPKNQLSVALQIRAGLMVNYCQSSASDNPHLSCNDHCDQWLFLEIFYYYYSLEILLNDLEFVFLEFNHFYITQRTSLFSFYLFIFLLVIL